MPHLEDGDFGSSLPRFLLDPMKTSLKQMPRPGGGGALAERMREGSAENEAPSRRARYHDPAIKGEKLRRDIAAEQLIF
jgi:hypothetical protein